MKDFSAIMKTSAIMLTGMFLLTGCATLTETEMNIHDENDITASVKILYSKEDFANQDELTEFLSQADQEIPADVEEKNIEEGDLIGRTYTLKHKTLSEQQESVLAVIEEGTLRKEDGKFIGDFTVNSDVTDSAETVSLKITAPGRMIEANNSNIDGKSATWNITEDNVETVYFVSEDASNKLIFVISGLLILGILSALAYLYMKKQKAPKTKA